jgi:hypothetical protein
VERDGCTRYPCAVVRQLAVPRRAPCPQDAPGARVRAGSAEKRELYCWSAPEQRLAASLLERTLAWEPMAGRWPQLAARRAQGTLLRQGRLVR